MRCRFRSCLKRSIDSNWSDKRVVMKKRFTALNGEERISALMEKIHWWEMNLHYEQNIGWVKLKRFTESRCMDRNQHTHTHTPIYRYRWKCSALVCTLYFCSLQWSPSTATEQKEWLIVVHGSVWYWFVQLSQMTQTNRISEWNVQPWIWTHENRIYCTTLSQSDFLAWFCSR